MSTYFNAAFTETEAKDAINHIFKAGLISKRKMSTCSDDGDACNRAHLNALYELFTYMLEWRFPSLNETRSGGSVQEYIKARDTFEEASGLEWKNVKLV